MRTGGLNEIFHILLGNKGISNQELIGLQKIENDVTELYHAKYDLDDKIMLNIESRNTANSNLIGRRNVKSLECIRRSINKNLDLMNEEIKIIFQSYLIECGELNPDTVINHR